jgi:hypothetical protein
MAWLVPAILAVLLLAGLATVLILARQAAKPDAPAQPGPFIAPAASRPSTTFDVQRVDGSTLTVTGVGNTKDSQQITLPAGSRIEVLDAITPADLHPGDWMTVIGVPNAVKSFGIRSIVVIGSPGPPDSDGIVLTPAGFAGNEAGRDAKELPILGGAITQASALAATVQTMAGPVTISFAGAPPLRKVRAGTLADVHEGDRLAFLTTGGAPNLGATLVLTGGAK